MCWIGKNEKKIAEKDIKAFKVGFVLEETGHIVSAYNDFYYDLGEKYEDEINVTTGYDSLTAIIDRAFHSYNSEKCEITSARLNEKDTMEYNIKCGNVGVDYWFSHDESPLGESRLVRMECTIPKGSVYYENIHGEIASNAIIVEGIEYLN